MSEQTRKATMDDFRTGETYEVSYTPTDGDGSYQINGIDVQRREGMEKENEAGIIMFVGEGIVAHIALSDLQQLA